MYWGSIGRRAPELQVKNLNPKPTLKALGFRFFDSGLGTRAWYAGIYVIECLTSRNRKASRLVGITGVTIAQVRAMCSILAKSP